MMDPASLRRALKELMISELNLSGVAPESIDDTAPLFDPRAGLRLDSLDALQLAMSIEERFGVRVPDGPEARAVFASVNALVDHILGAMPGADAAE